MERIAVSDNEVTLNVTRFKAECLDLFKRLEEGKLKRVTVTRRGRPVAQISPPRAPKSFDEISASMQGTITVAPGVDLLQPVVGPEEWNVLQQASSKDEP
jgi:antitoxin (DNA-binding transcriptional repressor) of toxin-antitoxin stability system